MVPVGRVGIVVVANAAVVHVDAGVLVVVVVVVVVVNVIAAVAHQAGADADGPAAHRVAQHAARRVRRLRAVGGDVRQVLVAARHHHAGLGQPAVRHVVAAVL